MADDDEKDMSSALATRQEREKYALRLAGQLPANECRFKCVTCAFDQTMQFDDDEMAALDNDITTYAGPCPKCQKMTLVPFERMFEDNEGIYSRAKESRRKEFEEQADVLLDKAEGRLKTALGGGPLPRPEQEPVPGQVTRDDLPPSNDLDFSDLAGKKGE